MHRIERAAHLVEHLLAQRPCTTAHGFSRSRGQADDADTSLIRLTLPDREQRSNLSPMDRRAFLTLTGAAGAVTWMVATRQAQAQAPATAPTPAPSDAAAVPDIPYGETPLKLAENDDDPEGVMYVPKSYKDGEPMPLLTWLHGLSGGATSGRSMYPLAEEFGVIILVPVARRLTWGKGAPGFDRDSVYIVDAMRYANRTVYMDPEHVAIGGVSDGATYALSMGLVYGDSFSHVMVFSEGIPAAQRQQGKPKLFIAHGTEDHQMPIDLTSHKYVPQFRAEGYDVRYSEYVGGHGAPRPAVREAFEWFTGKPSKPA
jgi:phospholipase/carboxylesterase